MIIGNTFTNVTRTKNECNKSSNPVAFKHKAQILTQLADESILVRASAKFSETGGEKVANIVNAAGKMLIAPLIIAFNPFSKEDKETKVYSAWKHPIEAVLTISIQLLALSKVDKYIDKLSNTGRLADGFNLKNLPQGDQYELISKRLGVFKDRTGIIVALSAIPVVTSITNWAYPKIMKKIQVKTPKKEEV